VSRRIEITTQMQGIYYLLSIVAVIVVFVWYVRNDKISEVEPTRGLLAMKDRARGADGGSPATKREGWGRRDKWRRLS
jgi:hypothetical protein